ncbi:MAG: FhaA domain-containing protein [Chloroflexus sp.]|uniref:FhaA domain-containing protein n=1 Tax=Chloroflexus sp. TaxID=1904827 RepID=UPI0040491C5F
MSALRRFEQFMEQMVEGSVARIFRSTIQPVEIARRLEKAMESNQTISVKRVIVPSSYRAFLNPQDFAIFQPVRQQIEQELATYLSELAAERNFTMLDHPRVVITEDPAVPRRSIQVEAEMRDNQSDQPTMTMIMQSDRAPGRSSGAFFLLQIGNAPQALPIATTTVTIGRGLDNDIILEDTRVSRKHAQLRYRQRRFWLTDLGSTNGTFVNGERISERALRDGDVVSMGGLELTFRES